jgi:hypothetical protein
MNGLWLCLSLVWQIWQLHSKNLSGRSWDLCVTVFMFRTTHVRTPQAQLFRQSPLSLSVFKTKDYIRKGIRGLTRKVGVLVHNHLRLSHHPDSSILILEDSYWSKRNEYLWWPAREPRSRFWASAIKFAPDDGADEVESQWASSTPDGRFH